MKKLYGILALSLFCWVLFFAHNVKSHETGEVVKDETARLIHQMSINITNELFKSLPAIFDSISAEIRMKADKEYNCSLQPDNYKNKECQ
jgi:hypothetical protein